ncbi:WASH complex subunit 3-like [Mercenaria mercenaria]|uniref:WASH complex subunit 3-like n=1 Tax=Mercenaria mercenaria TaxID=6596 RepID=UPI00234E93C5|nr:WASH complex subunit 3-like [Mercenaria mercenaria]
MDADGLPLVGPGVDYTKVESISQKRLVAFLNHFVSHTAGFLNRFSCVCEEKLEQLSHRMQQLEITMNLLEAKISSIPGLENVTAASGATSAPQTSTSDAGGAPAPPAAPAAPPTTEAPAEQPTADSAAPPPPAEEPKPSNPVSKDPRYMKYFKMVQVGVPEHAVKMKMSAEGLNPDLLDTPDAPAPASGANDDDDDDFSDSSNNQSDDSDDFD